MDGLVKLDSLTPGTWFERDDIAGKKYVVVDKSSPKGQVTVSEFRRDREGQSGRFLPQKPFRGTLRVKKIPK